MTQNGNDTSRGADEVTVDVGDLRTDDDQTGGRAELRVEDDTTDPEILAAPGDPAPIPTSRLSLAVQKLQNKVRGLEEDKLNLRDRLLRTAADYDNFKKRSRKELTERSRQAEDQVVLDFLPVLDNLERALAHAAGREADPLVDGVEMVHKQFLALLERYGITPVQTLGEPFDPEFHEAIQQVHSDQPAGRVCYEMQKGYRRKDRLVRPAMVVVSKGPEAGEGATAGGNDGDET